MKIYPISMWAFYGICFLILLLPVSRHWRLIAQGKKVQGTVTGYTARHRELGDGHVAMEYASEIVYTVGDTTYRTYGPTDLEYREDRKVPVLVDPGEPSRGITLTFSAIYLNLYSAVSVVLLILWAAFYLSFNSYSKRTRDRGARDSRDSRGEGTRDLASSPYRPFGKKKHGKKREDGAREKGENGAGEQGSDDPGEHEQGGGPDTGRKSLRAFLLVALLASFHLIPALNNPAMARGSVWAG